MYLSNFVHYPDDWNLFGGSYKWHIYTYVYISSQE